MICYKKRTGYLTAIAMTCVLGVAGAGYKTYSVIAEDSSNIVKVKNSGVLGDVNGDGTLNLQDASLVLKTALGYTKTSITFLDNQPIFMR